MKFKYKKLSSGQVRPIIPISIHTKDSEVGYYAMVDSGADLNIFPGELGEFLGLEVEKGKKQVVAGVVQGEQRPYYIHNVEIEVGGWRYLVPVGFMPDLSRNGYGLLGQHGFFDQFKSVTFKKQKDILEIER